MRRITFFAIACLFSLKVLAQDENKAELEAYLSGSDFGDYTFKKSESIKMTKAEDEFRAGFKTEFLEFINTYGNSKDMEADFDMEDMTDAMISDMYHEVFELDELSPKEIEENAALAGIDHDHFVKMVDHCHRFVNLKDDPSGSYSRTIWTVISGKERVTLTFYLNDQNQVIDFQEDWPDF